MRKPFVMRVQNDDPAIARELAIALIAPLMERGARVRWEGDVHGSGPHGIVNLVTSGRGVRGTSIALGVYDDEIGARWLTPLETDASPEQAREDIMAFLERWGFVGSHPLAASARPASTS